MKRHFITIAQFGRLLQPVLQKKIHLSLLLGGILNVYVFQKRPSGLGRGAQLSKKDSTGELMAIQLRITVLTTEFKVILFLGQKSANFFFLTPSPKFSNLLNFFSEHLKIDVGRYEIYIMKRKLARQFLLLVKHSTGNHTLEL